MKVMCIKEGNQKNEDRVFVGETYWVERIVDGWEVLTDNDKRFYKLKGKNQCVYSTHLFARLSENKKRYQIQMVTTPCIDTLNIRRDSGRLNKDK